MKLPLEISKIIEITDPVYTFCEVMDHIDLNKYLAVKECRTGRPRYDSKTMLKIVLFAFMENGYVSTRAIEKLCKTDIRFMWLLDNMPAPSHMKIDNFMNEELSGSIEEINSQIVYMGVGLGLREEYAIEYLEEIIEKYKSITGIEPDVIARGR